MPVSILVRQPAESSLRFGVSPLAELVAALHLLSEPAHHLTQSRWITETISALDPELKARITAVDYLWRTSRADMLLPSAVGNSLVAELDDMDRLDDELWAQSALITSSCGVMPLDDSLRSPLVDSGARAVALARASLRGERQRLFAESVLNSPNVARRRLRTLLEDCDREFFSTTWADIAPVLKSDAVVKAHLVGKHGPVIGIAAVAPGLEYDSATTMVTIDKLQDYRGSNPHVITFIPTLFGRPHLLAVHSRRWQPVIQYPLAQAVSSGEAPPSLAGVEARLAALSHPTRLRLIRSLIRGNQTTRELAQNWNLTEPEVSRHIAVLRDARLIYSQRRGRYVDHVIDIAAVERVGADTLAALLK